MRLFDKKHYMYLRGYLLDHYFFGNNYQLLTFMWCLFLVYSSAVNLNICGNIFALSPVHRYVIDSTVIVPLRHVNHTFDSYLKVNLSFWLCFRLSWIPCKIYHSLIFIYLFFTTAWVLESRSSWLNFPVLRQILQPQL